MILAARPHFFVGMFSSVDDANAMARFCRFRYKVTMSYRFECFEEQDSKFEQSTPPSFFFVRQALRGGSPAIHGTFTYFNVLRMLREVNLEEADITKTANVNLCELMDVSTLQGTLFGCAHSQTSGHTEILH